MPRPKPSTRSSNPDTHRHAQKTHIGGKDKTPARAHRDDTPEAKQQRARLPKTHPNSSGRWAAARKSRAGDKE